jgi:uncharacterized protein YdcH (DUF465 family)
MTALQLDLFIPYDENTLLRQEISDIKESMNKQRKSLFAKHNDLAKMIIELKEEVYALKQSQIKRIK